MYRVTLHGTLANEWVGVSGVALRQVAFTFQSTLQIFFTAYIANVSDIKLAVTLYSKQIQISNNDCR